MVFSRFRPQEVLGFFWSPYDDAKEGKQKVTTLHISISLHVIKWRLGLLAGGVSLQIRGHNELAHWKNQALKPRKKTLVFRTRPLTMYIMLAQLHFQGESYNAYKKVPT